MTEPRREATIIDLDDDRARQRYRCPRGHTNWEPLSDAFYCRSCARQDRHGTTGAEPHFDALEDAETGARIDRDAVTLQTEHGDWRAPRSATEALE
jgi:hypothetical protein